MHWCNELFFNKVLPEFLHTTRDLFEKYSLFLRLDKIEVKDGTVDADVESDQKDMYERILGLCKHIGSITFSSTAVQCYRAVVEQFNVIYSEGDKVDHPVGRKISSVLGIPHENVSVFRINSTSWLIQIDRPAEDVTSESELTTVLVEVLQLVMDLNKKIKSIEQIQYPVACFGELKILVSQTDGVGNLDAYGTFGSRCINWTNIRVESEETSKELNLLEQESSCESPTVKCMAKIGINCECIDRHETFISMGLDSLQCAELEMVLQSEFPNYRIPTGIAMEKPTIEEMDTYLMSCSIACDTKNKDDNTYSNHIPLSPQQKGLVFLNELEPHARAQFNEPVVFAMKTGDFDGPRFRAVLNTLVMRHSVLRTIYFANGQSILSGTEAFFTCRKSQVDPQTFVRYPIDIKSTSMHAMVCDSVDCKVVCLVFQHIAVDGHSINIITREIGMMYSGRKLPLPRRHYADYARHTSDLIYEKQLAKWRQKLNHREFQLLITDKSRTAKRTYNGATTQRRIPPTLQKSLRKLRQAANCTNFCIFVAVYKFLIYKIDGISDFPIGFPSTLRSKEYAHTVGCFVNVVPLVEPFDPSYTLVQYLNRLSATIAEAKSFEVPLDVLISDLGIERDGNVSPLFQVLLVQDNVQLPAVDTSVVLLKYTTQLAKYEQSWYFQNDGKSINISVEYNRDLFQQQTIEDLIDRFLSILGTFERLPLNRMLSDVAITKPVELNSIHEKINSNIRDIPKATFLEIFRANLPTTSSIKFKERRMSYQELDEENARIAGSIVVVYSSHYGELPTGDRCAVVFMERSLHFLAVIFAIWRSGMVAVPISLDWPPQRTIGMLKLFNNPILVGTKSEKLNSSAKQIGIPVLDDELRRRSCARSFNRVGLSDLAYITCTSGTTGTPKAVCTQFSGHSNLATAYTETYFLHNNSHTYQVVNCGFDIFFADLTKTFVNGASITLAEELIPNPAEMEGVTNAYIMPAYLSTLSLTDIDRLSFLETVHFGGEAIQASALRSLLQTGVNIYQEYGVTEQTVYTTCNRMNVCSSITDIGAPYRNLHCLLRDQNGQLLPTRYQGICYLSGCGLFRGYYGNETLTTKAVQQGAFGKEFRTGDLMKCEHGSLYCQGRHELQVKIRGRLIDLVEVQLEIAAHKEVSGCTVTVHEENGSKELVAYIIYDNDCRSVDELVQSLSERLPSYCIPKHFIQLRKFPLTQNGKIDKALLPKPAHRAPALKTRPPQGKLETAIVKSFKKYTSRDFMANECFFDFGGDSVKAMLTVQDLASHGYKVDLKTFFSLRTAEKIACHLASQECAKKMPTQEFHATTRFTFDIPLSPQQKRLWFLSKMYPERDSYVIHLNVSLKGPVDIATLKNSFNAIVINNPVMRSVIVLPEIDPILVRLSGTECFYDLNQHVKEDSKLDGSSLVVAQIVVGRRYCRLDLRIQHLICDGRSLAIIGEQLAIAYNGGQIRSYGTTEHMSETDDSMEFWKAYLKDYEPPVIHGEGDKGARDGEAGYIEVALDFVNEQDLREVGSIHGCTLYQILVLCYVQTIRTCNDLSDIVIGTTVANRTPENMNTVGLFVETIPLRFKEEIVDTAKHLRYVGDQILSAMEHQTTPLTKIIEEVVVGRELATNPLFRHVLTLESASIKELPKMRGIESEVIEPRTAFTQFDQSWIFHQGEELHLLIQYDKSRFTASLMREHLNLFKFFLNRLLKQKPFTFLMHSMTASPIHDTPRCRSLGTIFAEQALLLPGGICLESKARMLSFQSVLDTARGFAMKMQMAILQNFAELPRSDDVICLILPESIENHIAMISAHLLGCAYLCLPPNTPTERIDFVLTDCQAQLVVTNLNLPGSAVPVLPPDISLKDRSRCRSRSCSDSLAYLIYTSGTTGKPKGVCVSHQSTLNMLEHATRLYHFRSEGRVLQFTKSSFDASVSNTFGSLLNGGLLSVRDENADVVSDLARRQPIAVLHMTPIVMEMFDKHDLARLSQVELWSFGGESISESTLAAMISHGQRLVQLYGPTEATCYQTSLKMKKGHNSTCLGEFIPGLPHILCSFTNPLVIRKSAGQVAFSGENLARGYTSAADRGFVENPFRTFEDRILRRNHRLYLVGDRLRRDASGCSYFLGRYDDQVKVRGHRVHLAEIESEARKIDGITNAAAVIQRPKMGSNQLILFYTGPAKDPFADLQKQFPPSMLPSRVIKVSEFPLTSNMKIDRANLSSMVTCSSAVEIETKPRDSIERQVLERFQEVLRQPEIGVNTNFFQAGGHSLLVVRLVALLKESFSTSVPIVKVFEYPRARELASWIRSVLNVGSELSAFTNVEGSEQPSPLQATLLRSFRNPKVQALYDTSLRVTLKKRVRPRRCVEIVNQLSMIHPSLRTRFIKSGRSYMREILSGTECFQNLNAEETVTFDPYAKPLFVARLDGGRICIIVNHLITDGHSMRVIVTSLMRILKDQKVSMDDGLKLHSWISHRFLQSRNDDLQYWKGLLKNFVYNQLPTTFPRLAINEAHAGELVVSGNWLASTVQSWVERYGCSPFVATLTLLSKTLQLLSCDPQLPVAIGFPVNLRNEELQNSVGYGVNTVVVFQDTHGTPAEVLQKVMAQVAGAMSHSFLPFEELVNLSPSKKLLSVMLTYDSYSIYENEELVVEPAAATVTKFEISIFVNPESDTIRFEYNRTLFDEEYISNLVETMQNIAHNWEYHIPWTVSDPLRIGGAVFDPSDIAKRIVPLSIKDLNINCTNGLELHYSSCVQIDDAIRRALMQLPRQLHPQKIVFNRKIILDFPLSSQQLQMYYLSLENPRAYVLSFLKKFPKTVSTIHLHRALLYEIQRHEALRTIFFEEQGQPKQMVFSMTEAYVSRTTQSTTALSESVELFCRAPLDLTHCVPIRVMLFEERDYIVAAMVLNHIISDAWSTTILERELSTVLGNLQNGRRPFICRQKYTFRDYCQEPGESEEIDEEYVDQLVSAEDIPLEEGRGEVERLQFEFPEVVTQRWTKRCGASLFVVMLMIISNSVMNLFGLKSVNVGAPHFNRSAKTKSLIGYFLNNLVFHIGKEAIELEGLQTLQRHVTSVLVKNIPFAELVASARRLRGNLKPLFQVYFNCRYDLEVDDSDDHDIMSMLPVTSQFPLEFDLDRCKDGYRITLRVQKGLNNKDGTQLMEDICRQLQSDEMLMELRECSQAKCIDVVVQLACKVLGVGALDQNHNFFSAGGNSLQVIAFVELLEEALGIEIEVSDVYQMNSFAEFANQIQSISATRREAHSRQVVLQEKNSNNNGPSVSNTPSLTSRLPRLESKSLSNNPNISLSNFLLKLKGYGSQNCLVEPGAPESTYAELTCSIECQAVSIRRSYCQVMGETLRSDTIIPIVGERSASTFISCLSVIAAGATYLPIDVSWPVERIKLLLKESQAECYLGADVSGTLFSRLSTTSPVRVRRLMNSSAQEDLAYIIYTSGTTGVPKGVCVKQESVINTMQSATVDFNLNSDGVVYQFTNFAYDNSVLEIFMTLANGAKLVVATETFTPRRFFSLMDQYGITCCLLFPGIVATFREKHFRRLAHLRYWIVGAEKFPQRMFDMAIEAGVSIIQNYGPTETTAYALTKHLKITDQSNNLGRAIRNTEIMVKEDGELLLRGKGLMRGYFGSTRQDVLLGGSWYATGDQVQSLPNGDVLFVGRRDSQVKIRGQRVELSEIEATVSAVAGVKQCVVVFEDQVLLAFITTDSTKDDVVRRILDKCSNSLPSHMRPTHVFPVDEFPLTKNAKVNLAFLRDNWKKYLWKDRLHDLVEKILEKKVDPELSFIEAGGSTKLAIKLSLLHMSKYGSNFNIAHLLQRPLKDVGADNEQNMCNENAKRTEMGVDERLRKIWQKLLKSNNIQSNDHFYFSGGNSISLIKLLYEINTEFGVHLKIQNLLSSLTFSEMSAVIGSQSTQMSTASTVHDPLAPRFSVVFIHTLYGGSAAYFELIRSLMQLDNFQIITVQHPNTFEFQSDDMKFYGSVQSVAERYAEEINRLRNRDSDVVLIGASFGGTIAVEIATYLKVKCKVIVIDSGTDYQKLRACTFRDHKINMDQILKNYAVDDFTKYWMILNSWDMLMLLQEYEPTIPTAVEKLYVFSIDGTDLGWSRSHEFDPCGGWNQHCKSCKMSHCAAGVDRPAYGNENSNYLDLNNNITNDKISTKLYNRIASISLQCYKIPSVVLAFLRPIKPLLYAQKH